jgi:hypothetical protein
MNVVGLFRRCSAFRRELARRVSPYFEE